LSHERPDKLEQKESKNARSKGETLRSAQKKRTTFREEETCNPVGERKGGRKGSKKKISMCIEKVCKGKARLAGQSFGLELELLI